MVGIGHSVCACESQEGRKGIPGGISKCPSIVHSHRGSLEDRSGCNAIWQIVSAEYSQGKFQDKKGKRTRNKKKSHILKNVGFRRVCHDKGRGVLLNALVLASKLYTPTAVRRHGLSFIDWGLATHPFESRFCRHNLGDSDQVRRRECREVQSSRVE